MQKKRQNNCGPETQHNSNKLFQVEAMIFVRFEQNGCRNMKENTYHNGQNNIKEMLHEYMKRVIVNKPENVFQFLIVGMILLIAIIGAVTLTFNYKIYYGITQNSFRQVSR